MAKAKKNNPGGASDHKRRGLRAIVVPVTNEVHELLQRAAGTYVGRDRAVSRFAAVALEEAARNRLEECGIEVPKKNSEKSSE